MHLRPRHEWDDSYTGSPPPWDIGRPQEAFRRLGDAGALSGAVLDAGCGTGEHTILAAQCGARALGIDVSQRAIDAARNKAKERGVGAEFQAFDALRLGSLPDRFDTVLDSGLFHTFDDAQRIQYVEQLHAVLRNGGVLYLMCFSDRQPGEWGPRRVSAPELRACFDAPRWQVDSIEPDQFDINPVEGATSAKAWLAVIERRESA